MGGPYNLKRFDIKSIKPNAIVCIIGKRRSGKSVLMRDIAWHLRRHLPFGIAMSPTEEANQFFGDFMPQSHIHYEFDKDAIEQILIRQQAIAEAVKRGQTTGLPKNRNAFIFADDCMYDKSAWRSKLIRNLFMNGRHWNMFLCFTMQYAMDIMPELRENVDYFVCFRNQNYKQKVRFFEHFFGVFESKQEFIKVFDEVAVDNDFIALDNTIKSNNVEDCVFWGRAEMRPEPFKLGSRLMWDFDRELNASGQGQDDPSPMTKAASRTAPQAQSGPNGGSGGAMAEPPKLKLGHVNKLDDDDGHHRRAPPQTAAAAAPVPSSVPQPQPAIGVPVGAQMAPPFAAAQPHYAPPAPAPCLVQQQQQRPPSPFRRGKRPLEGKTVRFEPQLPATAAAGPTPGAVHAVQSHDRPPSPFASAKRRRRT